MISGRLPRITRSPRRGQVQRKLLDATFEAELVSLLALQDETHVAIQMHNTLEEHDRAHRDAVYGRLSLGTCLV